MTVKELITELHRFDGQSEVWLNISPDMFHDFVVHHTETKAHEQWDDSIMRSRTQVAIVLVGGRRV